MQFKYILFLLSSLVLITGCTQPDAPVGASEFTVWTSPMVTSPQIPFWAAVHKDALAPATLHTELWKNPQQLQSAVLAGQGDFWIGHIEGFARARQAGAPVKLLAVTGWRKFHLITRDPSIQSIDDALKSTLYYSPPGSPAATLIAQPQSGASSILQAREARQLAMLLLRGDIDTALVPEPFATSLITKDKSLRAVEALADYCARRTGGPARLPLAGLAVNEHTAAQHPELIQQLLDLMMSEAQALASHPNEAAAVLPDTFSEVLPRAQVAASLSRDPILVLSADAVRVELAAYLALAGLEEPDNALEDLIWTPIR